MKLQTVFRFENQRFELLKGLQEIGMIALIAEGVHGHDRIHDGRIDSAEASGEMRALDHPFLGFANGFGANVFDAAALPKFDHAIGLIEESREQILFWEAQLDSGCVEFVERESGRRGTPDTAGLNDGKRDNDGARPGRHFVEQISGDRNQLRRHAGRVLSREKSKEAEVDFGIAVGFLQAA